MSELDNDEKNRQQEVGNTEVETLGEQSEEVLSVPRKLVRYLRKEAWKDLLSVALMVFLILNFVGFRAVVPSGSMLPTLQIDHSYLVSIITTHFRENKGLEHGDIVVFRHELEMKNDDLIVKRVIGLPGDEIQISNGVVRRNGENLKEDYILYPESSVSIPLFIVPENHIYVLGDNRASSFDGRYWEYPTISLDDVVGEMILFS